MEMRSRFIWAAAILLILSNFVASEVVLGAEVIVDGTQQYQTIEGFGTCLIAWVGRFRELYRTQEFQRIYAEGVGCNMLRVNMWGPTFEKQTEDFRQITYEDFDMSANNGRARIFVDFGRGILKINPEIKIIGTVWSPPSWMKLNKSITDKKSGSIRAGHYRGINNRVDPKYYRHFCKWMVEYVKIHQKMGVPFYAVSTGNEVQFTQSFESCVWDAKDYVTIIVMLREMLDAEGFDDVKIFGPETMTSHLYQGGTGSYVKAIKDNAKALKALDIFATHGYEDGVKAEMSATSSAKFLDLIEDTDKPFWITEGGTGGHDWPEPIQEGIGNALHNALVAGNCSAFVPWQITERRKNTHGIMLMSTYTPKTYTAMHYSKFIRPGARRIEARPGFGSIQVGGFLHNKDGDVTIVAINPNNRAERLTMTFRNLTGLASLNVYRTSATESMKKIGQVEISSNKAAFEMVPLSIVTFAGKLNK
jgi:O-glycosyl hydrolase